MKFRLMLVMASLALALGGAACNGSGGKSGGSPTAAGGTAAANTPVADDFDPNILTGFVLHQEDVPTVPFATGIYNPGAVGVSFTSFFIGDDLRVQATVAYDTDPAQYVDALDRLRRAAIQLTGPEQSYNLPGAEQAFFYRGDAPPGSIIVAVKGSFLVFLLMQSVNGTHAAEAEDEAQLTKYTNIVFGRLLQYIADPTSVRPDPKAPPYTPVANRIPPTPIQPTPTGAAPVQTPTP